MKIKENVTQYEDFKYVLQDTGNIYLGAQFSYEELLEQEMVPFKLKAILTHYILKEQLLIPHWKASSIILLATLFSMKLLSSLKFV